MRMLAAILAAMVYSVVQWREPVHRAWGLLLMFRALLFGQHVTYRTFRRRIMTCEQCPIFYTRLRTCGSPLTNGLGCWCHMDTKARLPRATCWLNDNPQPKYRGWGWPKELEDVQV